MSGTNSMIRDLHSLHYGLVPQDIESIFVDRELSENSIITKYYNRYLQKGKFSDLIKSDIDYVFKNQAPQLRPIIGSLGGGKSSLIAMIQKIVEARYPDNSAVVRINMNDYGTIRPEALTRRIYQDLLIKLRPMLKDMITGAGTKIYTGLSRPYFIPVDIIDGLRSQDPNVEEKAFKALLGMSNDNPYKDEIFNQTNTIKGFLIDLFARNNKILVVLYDEVDIFVKLNKDTYPSSIDTFTYIFLRDFTDRDDGKRPVYVAFTCEREMYEYIKDKCENFYRVASNHEIIMKQFSDKELFTLADNVYRHIILPIFGNKSVRQLPEEVIQKVIDDIRTRPKLNETTPGYFLKDYINEFLSYNQLDYDQIGTLEEKYESMAFNEFERMVRSILKTDNRSIVFKRKESVQSHQFDGYAELIERGIPTRKAYGEFTMSIARPGKVNEFIDWLEHLKITGHFNRENGDFAIFISPEATEKARKRLEDYGIHYVKFLSGSDMLEEKRTSMKSAGKYDDIARENGPSSSRPDDSPAAPSTAIKRIKEFILNQYSGNYYKKYTTIRTDIYKTLGDGIEESDIIKALLEMQNEKKVRISDTGITDSTCIRFK